MARWAGIPRRQPTFSTLVRCRRPESTRMALGSRRGRAIARPVVHDHDPPRSPGDTGGPDHARDGGLLVAGGDDDVEEGHGGLWYIGSSPLLPAKLPLLPGPHLPGDAVKRRRGEVVLDLLADLPGGRRLLGPSRTPKEGFQVQGPIAATAAPPSLHIEHRRVRGDPATLEGAQGIPEPEPGDAQLAVRCLCKALDGQRR